MMKTLKTGHAAIVGAWLLAPASAAQAAEFVVLIQGLPAGHLQVQAGADGRVETDFSCRDNGCGPDQRETFVLDARGVPVSCEVTGRSTFGAEMREPLRREGGRAVWTSRADEGEGGARGRIERGCAADLALIDGAPSLDSTQLRRASLVVQGRFACLPAQRDESTGFKPFVPGARFETPAP